MNLKLKKIVIAFSKTFFALFLLTIAVLAVEIYLMPRLLTSRWANKFDTLKKASEKVTIINKTEEVIIKDDEAISSIVSQSLPSVVNIFSFYPEKEKKAQDWKKNTTGVISTSDGIIATYRNGILENGAEYFVKLHNGTFKEAKLLGIDEYTNIAFLKVKAENLSIIPLAEENELKPGKKIIVIGSNENDNLGKFAAGIISGINKNFNISGKTLSSSEKLEGVLETDFINSLEFIGCPAVTYQGEMVGLIGLVLIDNKEKYFLIPSGVFKESLEMAVRDGFDQRPVFGVYYISLNKPISEALGIKSEKGALVYSASGKTGLSVLSNTSAEKAGIVINDIILAVDDEEVNADHPLSMLINKKRKGDLIKLKILRNGEVREINVSL